MDIDVIHGKTCLIFRPCGNVVEFLRSVLSVEIAGKFTDDDAKHGMSEKEAYRQKLPSRDTIDRLEKFGVISGEWILHDAGRNKFRSFDVMRYFKLTEIGHGVIDAVSQASLADQEVALFGNGVIEFID